MKTCQCDIHIRPHIMCFHPTNQITTPWSVKHPIQTYENWNPYLVLHHIVMNRQLRSVVNYIKSITIKSNITNNYYYYLNCPRYFLMHEFYHCLIGAIFLMFLVGFWHYQKLKQCFIFYYETSLLQQMQDYKIKIAQFSLPSPLPSHLQLGQHTLSWL
jgi:hypothetical protein